MEEVRDFFTEEGCEVKTAETGKEGIEMLMKYKPDVLLLDMKLPDMSGIDVLRVCKEISPASKIIVNTGYVDQAVIDEAERLGRDAFLQKPFSLEFLHNEIMRLVGKQ